ncbi:NAD-dependent epimerase/dehydratase family protein [bacterium]|nr:NAD-dependent epimerase/dehydratase family protein [bacterium]
MKVFITGITGFVGRYLTEYLLDQKGVVVGGTSFLETPAKAQKLFNKKVKIYKVDLLNKSKIDSSIKSFKPDVIFHLAGISSTSNAWEDSEFTLKNNIFGQLNLLNSIKEYSPKARLFIVSSAQVYGNVSKKDLPTSELVFPKPTNPYSVSKLSQEMLGYQFFNSFGLDVVILRPSNHIGPRQEGNFVVSRFAEQIANIDRGLAKPTMSVGNLEAMRDFTDVRDIVKAYFIAIKKAKKGEVYNLGSDKAIKIKDILNILLSFSSKKITVEQDKRFMHPSDIPVIEVSSVKFRRATGWRPKIIIKETLKEALTYWKEK